MCCIGANGRMFSIGQVGEREREGWRGVLNDRKEVEELIPMAVTCRGAGGGQEIVLCAVVQGDG